MRRADRVSAQRLFRFARRLLWKPWSLLAERAQGLEFVAPCYLVRPILGVESTVLDCGTGRSADFSLALMTRFGVRAIGVDPTIKHRVALRAIEEESLGRFSFLPVAVSAEERKAVFFQSEENESGSLFLDHINVKGDRGTSYEVDTVSLDQLLAKAGPIDLLKLDIEGAEYEVLNGARDEVLRRIPQIIVEFHHETVDRWRQADTLRLSKRLQGLGYRSHTRDFVNYLFFRPSADQDEWHPSR